MTDFPPMLLLAIKRRTVIKSGENSPEKDNLTELVYQEGVIKAMAGVMKSNSKKIKNQIEYNKKKKEVIL